MTEKTYAVTEKVVGTRTVYVTASSPADALKRARNGDAYDWTEIDLDNAKSTYSKPEEKPE